MGGEVVLPLARGLCQTPVTQDPENASFALHHI